MSKLADKIRKASRLESQPLGFVTSRAAKEATMVLGGIAGDAAGAAEHARRGADFVILMRSSDAKAADSAIPGAWIEGDADAATLKQGGFDFVVFDPDRTSSSAVLEENIGYVMRLPHDMDEVDLRAVESFHLDAVDVGAIDSTLTVRRQIALRRIFGLTRKPLLATVGGDISVQALQALRDTNVIAVAAERPEDVERLRKTIDALPPRSRRKDDPDRPVPLVPRSAPGGDHDDDDDDDD